jgi:hypothetical protein
VKPLISKPGAYPDISAEDYHRAPNLLPAPSLSSSGAKKLLSQSPFHFFFDSPMNPDRPSEEDKGHLNVGKAAHDMLLLTDRWPEAYHVLPEDFAWNKTKAMPDAIAEAEEARAAGKTLLKHDEAATVRAVAAALRKNELAMTALTNGVTEETLAWQDPLTRLWLRARPDFRPNSIPERRKVRVVADLKFMASTFCSPQGFQRAIGNFGYHQSAAFYSDGLKAIYDQPPTHWLHIVVEKDPPHSVSLYELPAEDIERGRMLNRKAIALFERCLSEGRWPAYADEPLPVGLTEWARRRIDEMEPAALAEAA